jgi:hypothetical protein
LKLCVFCRSRPSEIAVHSQNGDPQRLRAQDVEPHELATLREVVQPGRVAPAFGSLEPGYSAGSTLLRGIREE